VTERIAQVLSDFFSGISPEFLTSVLAALPLTELRGSIPWATFVLDLDWRSTLLWSIAGNLVPVPLILLLIEPVKDILCRFPIFERFFAWLFARTHRRGRVVERYRAIGLALFVAIPLPVTGAWTGSLAAFIFGIRFLPAVASIAIGVTIAGVIITLACQGILGFWDISRQFVQ